MSAIAFNGEIFPSGARAAADQVYDNSTTGLPANVQGAIDKTTGNITALDTVELTATAAHPHAVGSTFLFIGQLVKTTAAIAIGDTIAVGTNVTNTDICSVLSELNSNIGSTDISAYGTSVTGAIANVSKQTYTYYSTSISKDDSQFLDNDITLVRFGGVVSVEINGCKNLVNSQSNVIGSVPVIFYPRQYVRNVVSVFISSSNNTEIYRVNINGTNGQVSIYPYNGVVGQRNLVTTFTYLANAIS